MEMDMLVKDLVKWASKQSYLLASYLFGPVAERRATQLSDVDVGLLVWPDVSKEEVWRLEVWWSAEWPEQIDLRALNHAPLLFQYEVITRGRRLWTADVNAVAETVSLIRCRYWELRPILSLFTDWVNPRKAGTYFNF